MNKKDHVLFSGMIQHQLQASYFSLCMADDITSNNDLAIFLILQFCD